jgi:hypothetical protein
MLALIKIARARARPVHIGLFNASLTSSLNCTVEQWFFTSSLCRIRVINLHILTESLLVKLSISIIPSNDILNQATIADKHVHNS